mmetsp:Transcript_413/g.878  ORF Transcript_413/g.878 Transcript_413/m.878 type:complete len:444 (+) Transcript_413:33-1364(+)
MVSFRTIFILCLAQIILLAFVSFSLQLIAIHRIDDSHDARNLLTSSHKNIDVVASSSSNNNINNQPVIAYVVTLTGCGTNDKRYTRDSAMGLITQGAAVLRHSIHLAHTQSNKYGFQMYAIVHPSAKECSSTMSKLGYKTLIRNTPFDSKDIQKKFLRENIDGASCCGRKEFVKLYAYTLVDHPVAVVLDLDSLVLKPLDDLFDAIILEDYDILGSSIPIHDKKNVKNLPKKVDAFYTKDYNMVNAGGEKYAGVQGGFLMARPNEAVFEEYIDIVLEGDYREGKGWGGRYGYFFGGMQIQGICAYFYGERHPDMGIELDRCRINSMVDSPTFKQDDRNKPGQCRDGRSNCEDCRTTEISDIFSAHLTICQKPWECIYGWDAKSEKLCSRLHSEWFRIRRSFEESREEDDGLRLLPDLGEAFKPDTYFGYCKRPGRGGYLPIKI